MRHPSLYTEQSLLQTSKLTHSSDGLLLQCPSIFLPIYTQHVSVKFLSRPSQTRLMEQIFFALNQYSCLH